jgi:hypothetical protein
LTLLPDGYITLYEYKSPTETVDLQAIVPAMGEVTTQEPHAQSSFASGAVILSSRRATADPKLCHRDCHRHIDPTELKLLRSFAASSNDLLARFLIQA